MKQIILSFCIAAFLFSCNQTSKPGYVIDGSIADSTQATILLQQYVDGEFVTVDSAQLVNGKFQMQGNIDHEDVYYLSKGDRDKTFFFLSNDKFTVEADSTLLREAKISGGETQTLYNDYSTEFDSMYSYMLGEYRKIDQEQDPEVKKQLEARADSLYENTQKFQADFVAKNPTSPAAAQVLTRIQYGKSGAELDSLLAQLDTSLAHTVPYQFIKSRIDALKKVAIGATAPDFTQDSPEGEPVTLSDVYKANELTLIDFWASWCGPCRAENPNVVKAYKVFHPKGFTVLGVSLDNNKERWLKAVEEDGLTWQHVSDLQGWKNAAAKEYAVNSIPANFLVNKEGEIVGANLRGEDLTKKLEELLK